MNILYLTNSPSIGGAETSLLAHLEQLDKTQFTPILICSDLLADKAREVTGVEVIPMQFYILHRLNPFVLIRFIQMIRQVIRIVHEKQIAIIHTNAVKAHYIGVVVAIITKIKLIWWIRDDTMNKVIFTLTRRVPAKIIYISTYIETYFKKGKNTIIIQNGTNIYKKLISQEEKQALKEQFNIKDQFVIVCTERLVAWKGIQVLLEALEQMKFENFICFIIGSGKGQRDDIEFDLIKQSSEAGLTAKVKFLGWRDDREKFYQISDVSIHPVTQPEPFGLVVIEAMAFGVPVISSALGGPLDIIQNNEDGLLVQAYNATMLAESIQKLLYNKTLLKTLGKNAQQKVQNTYTQEIETKQIERVYTSVR